MKKRLALTVGFVTLALIGTEVMVKTQAVILNTGYSQWSQPALLTNSPNRQPVTAKSGPALPNFDYNFEKLVNNQTIFGQDKWVKPFSHWGDAEVRNGPGANQTQSAKGVGVNVATGATRPLDQPFYYTAKDTKIVWSVWGNVPSGSANMNAIGGLNIGGSSLYYFGSNQVGPKLTTFLQQKSGYVTGDELLHDRWYEYRVIVDFSKYGGEASLSYREVTMPPSVFKDDNTIKGVNLGLVPDTGGRYFFSDVIVRNDGAGYVDNLHFDAPAPAKDKGMTWFHRESNATYGTITVGCGAAGPNRCDPAHGDTPCTQQLPVLCIYKPTPAFQLPIGLNDSDQYNRWSGGVVATTQPRAGNTFPYSADASTYCRDTFGDRWRVAEFHDGWGWNFQAYGGTVSAPTVPSTRFWVHINDQPDGNCWQP